MYNGDVLYMTLCTTYTRAAAAAAAFGYLRIYFQTQIFSSRSKRYASCLKIIKIIILSVTTRVKYRTYSYRFAVMNVNVILIII